MHPILDEVPEVNGVKVFPRPSVMPVVLPATPPVLSPTTAIIRFPTATVNAALAENGFVIFVALLPDVNNIEPKAMAYPFGYSTHAKV